MYALGLIWCLLLHLLSLEAGLYDTQPQIITEDGNLIFQTADNYNIVLKTRGRGTIKLNDVDLIALVQLAQNASALANRLRVTFLPWVSRSVRNLTSEILGPNGFRRQQQVVVERALTRIEALEQGMDRVTTLEQMVQTLRNADASRQTTVVNRRVTQLRNRVNLLQRQVRRMRTVLGTNECESNPCQHGGTCFDAYSGYFCLCTEQWEGAQCQLDVNECYRFTGTDLGCQNGATCINGQGTFECRCTPGWFGTHCSRRDNDCSSGSERELCGHGRCINQHSGSAGYMCICDSGWKSDGMNPACTVDVDECSNPHPACSRNPLVPCINYPGSYHCGNCPAGYTGNGFYCDDIDECLANNGGCSTNPMVQCTNTMGSRVCGPCPPGYQSDGYSCSFVGACNVNNGGCHPMAHCISNAIVAASYVSCVCPSGYTGNGVGARGCMPMGTLSNECQNNPCVHGTCASVDASGFTCTCFYGYTGPTCSVPVNPCDSSPCLNGGTCMRTGNGYTCSCLGDFSGDRCEQQQQSCIGQFSTPQGVLQFPHGGNSGYSHNKNCMWYIETTVGKILSITFTQFNLEQSSECMFDWLAVYDGTDAGGHLIGKFCGTSLPRGGTFNSTHHVLFLWFHSDHSMSGEGFALHWTTLDPVCGDVLRVSQPGAIVSPGYPGRYPANRDCYWTLAVDPGKRIQLTFGTIQLQSSTDCSRDYVEIRDGPSETSPPFQQFCNSTGTLQFTTSGSSAWIHFHSDLFGTDTGFHLTYSEVPGIPGCGGWWTHVPGSFFSPGYPDSYQHNLNCEWYIRLQPADKVSLTFLTFDLEAGGAECWHDYVEIREGLSSDGDLVGRYCGRNVLPPPYRSLVNGLYVRFFTDSSVTGKGFQAKYDAACADIFTAPNGTIHSPFYPEAYPANRDCTFVVSQPVGKAIRLDFLMFDIESGWGSGCPYDYVEVRDGNNENSTLVGRYCGPQSDMPGSILSTYNYLWIRFATDGSQQNLGFLANYSTIDIGCGGILTDNQNSITYPENQEPYAHGARCQWIIHVAAGRVIRLSWQSFNLEHHSQCMFDSVTVFDNSSFPAAGSFIGRYCGNDLPPTITSTGEMMTIIFKSDESFAADGFSASYVTFDASTMCGGNYYSESGDIKSPGYPVAYPHNKDCVWIIQVPEGQQILLNITSFDLESHADCAYDFVEIRNGARASSPLVGKYCGDGSHMPRLIPSFGYQMYVRFKSDSSWSRSGFRISWDGTARGCGGVLNGSTGSIASPNYPVAYGRSAECFWRITVSMGNAIHLTFVDMEFEEQQQCYYDYVEIFDGRDSSARSLGRFCHGVVSVNSTGPSMWIKFRSDSSDSGRGFLATYEAACNRQIRGWNGVIESPNFPHPYPHNRNCTWIIMAPYGNKINVTFSHFDVEEHFRNECRYDFLELRESSSLEPANVIGRYCGGQRPPHLVASTVENVFVTFVSDSSEADNGFRLEWVVNGCGGIMRRPTEQFSSPNFPNLYHVGVDCQWYITVEPGNSIELNISTMDIEGETDCQYDYLAVYGGPDETAPRLSLLCHRSSGPVVVSSTGNSMFVHFHSDISVSGRGFQATYTTKVNGCGGRFTAPEGTIHTLNYPDNYGNKDDCSWIIQVNENHVVELNFTDFDVEPGRNCSYDSVSVYDGDSMDSPLLMVHCGASLPVPALIRSSGNKMYVRMKADGSQVARGFQANYKMGCGAVIVTESSGELSSPDFPQRYMKPLNCTWRIMGARTDDHVTIAFTHLDVETNEDMNCTYWYIDVRDGPDMDAPLLHHLCGRKVPPAITSQSAAIFVHIFSQHWHGARFRAVYSVTDAACGGHLTSDHGTFANPGFPNSYPPNVECVWTISASHGGTVTISFLSFDLEQSDYCNNDFVEIHANSAEGPLLGHFCGSDIPTNITAAQVLWIKFRSNEEGYGKGFVADYSLVHGNELVGQSGDIYSPHYPQFATDAGEFTWRVTVAQNMAINLAFVRFYLERIEQSESCRATMVVYDGYDDVSNEILRRCGSDYTLSVTSTSNVVFIKFINTEPVGGSVFQIHWLEVAPSVIVTDRNRPIPGCRELVQLSPENGTYITSPGYPDTYDPNLLCEWMVEASADRRVSLSLIDVRLEHTPNCYYDSLDIYDGIRGEPEWLKLESVCDHTYAPTDKFFSSGKFMKLVFRTDSSYSRNGFKVLLEEVCGGNVSASEGFIRSPLYPNNYPAQSTCDWIVRVGRGRKIALEIRSIDIFKSGAVCGNDFLMFRNGENIESPMLGNGKYCGNTPEEVPETIGNKLHIRFSSQTNNGQGFSLHFREVRAACGGQHILSEFVKEIVFTSPNFPNIPSPHTECEWVIVAPGGDRIQLDFLQEFKLTYSVNCTEDFVEVRDGGTINSPTLGKFCKDMPPTQISSNNAMYVRYFTDVVDPQNGFKAKASIAVCGGTIISDNGTISTPNYPATYGNDLECIWMLRVPFGHYVSMAFLNFNLPFRRNCSMVDNVQIYEMINGTYESLGLYCGSRGVPLIESAGNQVKVVFRSDNVSQSNTGFRLHFNASREACGGEMSTPSGVFQSPGYPHGYSHIRICTWSITVPEDRRVSLQFLDFDLTPRVREGGPCTDFVFIKNGDEKTGSVTTWMCGSDIPDVVESSSNEMSVAFRTRGHSTHRGFKAQYTSNQPIQCGGVINSTSGWIASPGYERGNYSNNLFCKWHFRYPNAFNSSLMLRIPEALLEFCPIDVLRIYGDMGGSKQLLKQVCGTITQEQIVASPYPYTMMSFSTDRTVVNKGFNLTYQVMPCGSILSGPYDVIMSPNFPNSYAANLHCTWALKYPDGQQIKVTFETFELENNCENDYLLIRNGPTPTSPRVGSYCGTNFPGQFSSASSSLWIEFHSNGAVQTKGFKMIAEGVSSGCGGLYHNFQSQIASPNFPSLYPSNVECEWEIAIEEGYHVILTFFERFDVELSDNCTNDFVQVYDKRNGQWNLLKNLCGKEVPAEPITASGHEMMILFRTNGEINADGFKARWNYTCGETITDLEGYVISPGYPVAYQNNLTCDYVITTNANDFVVVEFDPLFEIEAHTRCAYDNITLYEGNTTMGRWMGVYCNTSYPPPVFSRGSILIRFQSDFVVTRRGFRFMYHVHKCGGTLDTEGIISSPLITGYSYRDTNCTWVFHAPSNKVVRLKFQNITMDTYYNYQYTYVAVYDGTYVSNDKKLGTYGGSTNNDFVQVKSHSNSMVVEFYRPSYMNRASFQAAVDFIYACGGVINVTGEPQTLRSLDANGDGNYNQYLDCEWLIVASAHQTLELNFSSIDIATTQNSQDCLEDFVEVRDGPGPHSPSIGSYCGTTLPPPLHSSRNYMWVRFVSGAFGSNTGFVAAVRNMLSPCGSTPLLNATYETQVLISPSFPNNYPLNMRCRWVVGTESLWSKVQLHFVDVDIESSSSCDRDWLEVRDVPHSQRLMATAGHGAVVYMGSGFHPRYDFPWENMTSYAQQAKFCGSKVPVDMFSLESNFEVVFVSNGANTARGFKLEYSIAGCDRTYSSIQGHIYSPNWPSEIPSYTSCTFIIEASENTTISVYFNEFVINGDPECTQNVLEIRDGANSTSPVLAKYCSTTIPNPVFSSGNLLRFDLRHRSFPRSRGYDITYTTSDSRGCGGPLYHTYGSFTSPGYPGNYNQTSDCRWEVEVPGDLLIQIVFDVFMIGSADTCNSDYLELYRIDVATHTQFLSSRYCGGDNPATYVGNAGAAVVRYVTSTNNTGIGWRIKFQGINEGGTAPTALPSVN